MRRTWTQIKNETMTEDEQRRAHMLAVRDLAEMELAECLQGLPWWPRSRSARVCVELRADLNSRASHSFELS